MQHSDQRQTYTRPTYIRSLHEGPTELVLALAGGGSLVLGDLLSVPGGSRTVIEATVPYSEESLSRYIGRIPEQYCSRRTARCMAMTSFHHALRYTRSRLTSTEPDIDIEALEHYAHLMGIGCTASLVTNRSKKGEYRVHLAAQTLRRTVEFSLQLVKDARSREQEEQLVADLILNVIETTRQSTFQHNLAHSGDSAQRSEAEKAAARDQRAENLGANFMHKIFVASPMSESKPAIPAALPTTDEPLCNTFSIGTTDDFPLVEAVPLHLLEGETIHGKLVIGSPPLVDLFFGKTKAVLWKKGEILHFKLHKELPTTQSPLYNPQAEYTQAIFSGSFNPVHDGHLGMIEMAEKRLGSHVALEMSVQNVDKPPLDYIELQYRLEEIAKARPEQAVWLTQTPLFENKAELFRGATFVVGADTLRRFAELRFHHESPHQLHDVLRMIAFYNCRFLVFARQTPEGIESLETLQIPDMLRSLCDEIPPKEFAMSISSSDLRREEDF